MNAVIFIFLANTLWRGFEEVFNFLHFSLLTQWQQNKMILYRTFRNKQMSVLVCTTIPRYWAWKKWLRGCSQRGKAQILLNTWNSNVIIIVFTCGSLYFRYNFQHEQWLQSYCTSVWNYSTVAWHNCKNTMKWTNNQTVHVSQFSDAALTLFCLAMSYNFEVELHLFMNVFVFKISEN